MPLVTPSLFLKAGTRFIFSAMWGCNHVDQRTCNNFRTLFINSVICPEYSGYLVTHSMNLLRGSKGKTRIKYMSQQDDVSGDKITSHQTWWPKIDPGTQMVNAESGFPQILIWLLLHPETHKKREIQHTKHMKEVYSKTFRQKPRFQPEPSFR